MNTWKLDLDEEHLLPLTALTKTLLYINKITKLHIVQHPVGFSNAKIMIISGTALSNNYQ